MTSGRHGVALRQSLRNLGYDPDALAQAGPTPRPKIYAENVRAEARAFLRDLLVAESLRYGVACAETAFVATRTEAGKKIEGTVPVANALPAGWSDDFLSSPAPAPAYAAKGRKLFMQLDGGVGAGAPPSASTMANEEKTRQISAGSAEIYSGTPAFSGKESILVDLSTKLSGLPMQASLSGITAEYAGDPLPQELQLLLYLSDDLVTPRARMNLAELAAQGKRPLNISYRRGQLLKVVLLDPSGKGVKGTLRITLSWR